MTDAPPPPDQVAGAPHPRDAACLFGQQPAEDALLSALAAGRLHHAVLLAGTRGIGKATLAYRLARHLIATPPADASGLFGAPPPPESLDIADDHPVARRMRARSEPGLRVVTRTLNEKTGRMRDEIIVDDIRRLAEFFHLSATDGGNRVVIVDAADDMNRSASNALLKMLEEPPAATTLLLIAHQPSRLLPTIRSRCRMLRLSPLGPDDLARALAQTGADQPADSVALGELSGGSVGAALRLINLGGRETYAEIVAALASMPNLDRPLARALAEGAAQRGAEDRFLVLIELLEIALTRLARTGATGRPPPEAAPNEAATFLRLSPDDAAARRWADLASMLTARLRHGRAVNLDPAALVLDTLAKLNDAARERSDRMPA